MAKVKNKLKGKLSDGYKKDVYSILDKILRDDVLDFVVEITDDYVGLGILKLLDDNGFNLIVGTESNNLRVDFSKRECWFIDELNDNKVYELPDDWSEVYKKITNWCKNNPLEVIDTGDIEVKGDINNLTDDIKTRIYFLDNENLRHYNAYNSEYKFTSLDNDINVYDRDTGEVVTDFDTSVENMVSLRILTDLSGDLKLRYYNSDKDGYIKTPLRVLIDKFNVTDKLKRYGVISIPSGEVAYNQLTLNDSLEALSEFNKNNFPIGKLLYNLEDKGDEVELTFVSSIYYKINGMKGSTEFELPTVTLNNTKKVDDVNNTYRFNKEFLNEVAYDLNITQNEPINDEIDFIDIINKVKSNLTKSFYINTDNNVVIDDVINLELNGVTVKGVSVMGYKFDISKQLDMNPNYDWESSFKDNKDDSVVITTLSDDDYDDDYDYDDAKEEFEAENGYEVGNEFYFTYINSKGDANPFYICPKSYWDKNKYYYDGHVEGLTTLPNGFEEVSESILSYFGDLDSTQISALIMDESLFGNLDISGIDRLIENGFLFNNDLQKIVEDRNSPTILSNGLEINDYITNK